MIKKRLNNYKYIYGPVSSWRLGRSLGLDPISGEAKVCTFDCVYCQVGKTRTFTADRQVFVPTSNILKEIKELPHIEVDYITFSGRGEPTLAANLGEIIKGLRKIRNEKIAVITNSSLIGRDDVRKELSLADLVMTKLDACSEEMFDRINRPLPGITLHKVIDGLKVFRSFFKGKLALQIMFIEENRLCVKELARLAREINPDEVQLNTPLRPCGVKPLSKEKMGPLKEYFKGMNVVCVYDATRKKTSALNKEETLRRRGAHD